MGRLSLALLLLELIAGMQIYLSLSVTPVVAADLNGQSLYGWLNGISQASLFLTIPLGNLLLRRFQISTLYLTLTALTVLAGIIRGAAPNMLVFIVGQALGAGTGGLLLAVGVNTVTSLLPRRWRQIIFALFSVVWLFSALVGPLYAAWITSVWSWRAAMVLYLPLLILARIVMALQLRRMNLSKMAKPKGSGRAAIGWALLLSLGSVLLAFGNDPQLWRLALVALGMIITFYAASKIIVPGVFTVRRGLPAIVALIFLNASLVFGVDTVVPIVLHDFMGYTVGELGILLSAGGASWAALGVICGRFPASSKRIFLGRMVSGILLISTGMLIMASGMAEALLRLGAMPSPITEQASFWMLLVGWTLIGLGMGLTTIDLANRLLDHPDARTNEDSKVATTISLTEILAIAFLGTVNATIMAIISGTRTPGPGASGASSLSTELIQQGLLVGLLIFLLSGILALAGLLILRRIDHSQPFNPSSDSVDLEGGKGAAGEPAGASPHT